MSVPRDAVTYKNELGSELPAYKDVMRDLRGMRGLIGENKAFKIGKAVTVGQKQTTYIWDNEHRRNCIGIESSPSIFGTSRVNKIVLYADGEPTAKVLELVGRLSGKIYNTNERTYCEIINDFPEIRKARTNEIDTQKKRSQPASKSPPTIPAKPQTPAVSTQTDKKWTDKNYVVYSPKNPQEKPGEYIPDPRVLAATQARKNPPVAARLAAASQKLSSQQQSGPIQSKSTNNKAMSPISSPTTAYAVYTAVQQKTTAAQHRSLKEGLQKIKSPDPIEPESTPPSRRNPSK